MLSDAEVENVRERRIINTELSWSEPLISPGLSLSGILFSFAHFHLDSYRTCMRPSLFFEILALGLFDISPRSGHVQQTDSVGCKELGK